MSQLSGGWKSSRRAEDADAIELGESSESDADSEGGCKGTDEPCGLPSPQPGAPPRRVASDAEASEPSPDARPRARPFAAVAAEAATRSSGASSGGTGGSDGGRHSIVFDAALGLYVDHATGAVFQEVT